MRRFYPFFPVIGGKALTAFEWNSLHFRKGQWVLLDLYGTNHNARLWPSPDTFQPERFRGWEGNAYTLVPQGARWKNP